MYKNNADRKIAQIFVGRNSSKNILRDIITQDVSEKNRQKVKWDWQFLTKWI